MTKAVKLAIKFAFEKLKLKRVYGRAFCFNPASKRVMEKAGLKLEGIARKEAKKDNKFIDSWLLARVK